MSINWPIPRSLASVLIRGPAQFGHPVGQGPSHVPERQAINIRALNGTGSTTEITRTIIAVKKSRLAVLKAGIIPEREPAAIVPIRRRRGRPVRRTRAPAITPDQLGIAIRNREAGIAWKTIAQHLKVSQSAIKNAVSRRRT